MSRLKIIHKEDLKEPIVPMSEEEFQQFLREDTEAAIKRIQERALRMDEIVERCKRREKKRLKKMELEGAMETERRECLKMAKKKRWGLFRRIIVAEYCVNLKFRLAKGRKKLREMEKIRRRNLKDQWLEDQKNKPLVQDAKKVIVVEPVQEWARLVPFVSEIHPFPLEAPLKGGSQDGVLEINLETRSSSKQLLHEFLQKKGEKLPVYKSYNVKIKNMTFFGCVCSFLLWKESYVFKVKGEYTRVRDAEHAVADEAYKKVALFSLDDNKDYEEMVNYKGCLQEFCVKRGWGYPLYTVRGDNGNFKSIVLLRGMEFEGFGKRKKIAENSAAKKCWMSLGRDSEDQKEKEMNYKSKLLMYCQKKKIGSPIYECESRGPGNNLEWKSRCIICDLVGLSSWCQNKKKAENQSSKKVCEMLDDELDVPPSDLLDVLFKDSVSKLMNKISFVEKIKDDESGLELLDEIIMNFQEGEESFNGNRLLEESEESSKDGKNEEVSRSLSDNEEDLGDEILF
jgi:dsRNA-specific ribonuclease